jgi:hypothetical protein
VRWRASRCDEGKAWGAERSRCPHTTFWRYSLTDARIGQACQVRGGQGRELPWVLWVFVCCHCVS